MRILLHFCLLCLVQTSFTQTIDSLQPTQILGGIGAVLTIHGSGFGDTLGDSYVSFLQEDNNYMPSTAASMLHYLSWSDSLIRLEMPVAFNGKPKLVRNGVESVSPVDLKVLANLNYRQVNPLDYIYLTDRNEEGGVTWYVHPDYWDNAEARQAIVDVFIEFRCKTGVNYVLEPLLEPVPLDLGQGKHIIAPDTSLAGGVVGLNDYLWFSCILGVESFYYRYTQLLRFSTVEDWYYGTGPIPLGKSKFRYALMHELGHAVGLGHVNELGQSMYPTITLWPSNDWSMRDSITSAEKEAMSYFVQHCQQITFNACGIKPMQPVFDCEDVLGNVSAVAEAAQPDQVFLVYPNPATSGFHIRTNQIAGTSVLQIRLLNMLGQTVLEQEIHTEEEIRLPNTIPAGIYLVQIVDQMTRKSAVCKLLVQ